MSYATTVKGHGMDAPGDWANGTPDFFSFKFTAGDLVTVGPAMSDARVALRAADSTVVARKPLDDAPALPLNSVYAYRIPATGTNALVRILQDYPADDEAIRVLYVRTLGRQPTDRELEKCRTYVGKLGRRAEAFEDLFWALVNSAEFRTKR